MIRRRTTMPAPAEAETGIEGEWTQTKSVRR